MTVTVTDYKRKVTTTYYSVENVEVDKIYSDVYLTIYQTQEKIVKINMSKEEIDINIDKE